MVVAIGTVEGVFKVYFQDRIQQRLAEQCTLTFQFLMVDRVQLCFVELMRLTIQFRVVESSTDMFLLLYPRSHLMAWMRLVLEFPQTQKSAWLGPHSGSE